MEENLKTLTVELKQPRVIDAVPIDFVSGEPVEREGKPTTTFRGQLIYLTNADLTIRRPSGAILAFSVPGLWALAFGSGAGGANGNTDQLFFTAGPGASPRDDLFSRIVWGNHAGELIVGSRGWYISNCGRVMHLWSHGGSTSDLPCCQPVVVSKCSGNKVPA